MQSVSRNAMRTLWLCHTESPVKKGMATLKAGIQAKLEQYQEPHKLINQQTGQVVADVPDTGPGTDSWVWNSKHNMLELSKAESDHLKEGYDAILESKGFPALLSIGVAEVSELLVRWSSIVKPDPPSPVVAETKAVAPVTSPPA